MKEIKLTKGQFALVDDEDFKLFGNFKWHYDGQYAARKNSRKIYLHRLISNAPNNKLVVDHINGNKLDNRRRNLRIVTESINAFNSKKFVTNTSGFKGISFRKHAKSWEVYIVKNYRKFHLGYFEDLNKAIQVRKQAEKESYAI